MRPLLDLVLDAHGGMDAWRAQSSLSVTARVTGELWARRGQEDALAETRLTLKPHRQALSFHDFKRDGLVARFRPDLVTIEDQDGRTVQSRSDPQSALAGQTRTSPWDDLSLAYNAGFDLWAYFVGPFAFVLDGVATREVPPNRIGAGDGRCLAVTFPETMAMHAREQLYLFDEGGEMQRFAYSPANAGVPSNVNLTSGYEDFGRLRFPTTRRMLPTDEHGVAQDSPVLMAVDTWSVCGA